MYFLVVISVLLTLVIIALLAVYLVSLPVDAVFERELRHCYQQ